jgi:hypothetical protein
MVGIMIFSDNAADRNRDAVLSDMLHLTARAQQYFRRPKIFGGGGGSYVGLTNDLPGMQKLVNTTAYPWETANGKYSILTAGTGTEVVLHGAGREPGKDDGLPVMVTIAVYPDSFSVVTVGGPTIYN